MPSNTHEGLRMFIYWVVFPKSSIESPAVWVQNQLVWSLLVWGKACSGQCNLILNDQSPKKKATSNSPGSKAMGCRSEGQTVQIDWGDKGWVGFGFWLQWVIDAGGQEGCCGPRFGRNWPCRQFGCIVFWGTGWSAGATRRLLILFLRDFQRFIVQLWFVSRPGGPQESSSSDARDENNEGICWGGSCMWCGVHALVFYIKEIGLEKQLHTIFLCFWAGQTEPSASVGAAAEGVVDNGPGNSTGFHCSTFMHFWGFVLN